MEQLKAAWAWLEGKKAIILLILGGLISLLTGEPPEMGGVPIGDTIMGIEPSSLQEGLLWFVAAALKAYANRFAATKAPTG